MLRGRLKSERPQTRNNEDGTPPSAKVVTVLVLVLYCTNYSREYYSRVVRTVINVGE